MGQGLRSAGHPQGGIRSREIWVSGRGEFTSMKNFLDKAQQIRALKALAYEASLICARHDGIHNVHGAAAGVYQWLRNAQEKIPVDWDNVNFLMSQLRTTDRTGNFPKE
jgi:hypothetical protein